MRCPTCRRIVAAERGPFRPFCSERCKLVDLGRWLDGSYAIPGEPAEEGEPEFAEAEDRSNTKSDRKLH